MDERLKGTPPKPDALVGSKRRESDTPTPQKKRNSEQPDAGTERGFPEQPRNVKRQLG